MKLASVTDYWSPVTVTTVNDCGVRVVKVKGEFAPHRHPETDEFLWSWPAS